MSTLRIRLPDGTDRSVDLGPSRWVPIRGHATLRGHAVVGQSGMSDDKERQAAYQRASVARKKGMQA
jgi:hypothetical protein